MPSRFLIIGLFVVSQTLFKIVVLPAFALPMYDEDSELDLWNSRVGLLSIHWFGIDGARARAGLIGWHDAGYGSDRYRRLALSAMISDELLYVVGF